MNDVYNYSIQICEYLYKCGFKHTFRSYLFDDAGHLGSHEGRSYTDAYYRSLFNTDSNGSNVEHKEFLKDTLGYMYHNIFAANEPNFKFNLPNIHTTLHLQTIANGVRKNENHLSMMKKRIITSDYNHTELNNELKDNNKAVYFFFQGYLAVQWYRQYRLFDPIHLFEHKFNSSSRIIDHLRVYRLYLTSKLAELDLLQYGQVSCSAICPSSNEDVSNIVHHESSHLNLQQRQHVDTHLTSRLPVRYDKLDHEVIPNTSYEIDWVQMSKSFLHVVNETVFYEKFNHLTEKVFKPICLMRPFVVSSTPGSLAYLRQYGFKTFGKWIDESYDQEINQHRRLDMIAEEVRKICDLSMDELNSMYQEMLPVLEHNRNLFYGSFEQDVLDELERNYRSAL